MLAHHYTDRMIMTKLSASSLSYRPGLGSRTNKHTLRCTLQWPCVLDTSPQLSSFICWAAPTGDRTHDPAVDEHYATKSPSSITRATDEATHAKGKFKSYTGLECVAACFQTAQPPRHFN